MEQSGGLSVVDQPPTRPPHILTGKGGGSFMTFTFLFGCSVDLVGS